MFKSFFRLLHRPIYEKRVSVLARDMAEFFNDNDHVLDVGCGSGALGARLNQRAKDRGVLVEGAEKAVRGGEEIKVTACAGPGLPFADQSFDVVILADVLHHEPDPEALLKECIRVTRRLILIKDHQVTGFLGFQRIALLDWAANAGYGVPCLYRYLSAEEWSTCLNRHQLRIRQRHNSMDLYPPVINALLGGKLHVLIAAEIPSSS